MDMSNALHTKPTIENVLPAAADTIADGECYAMPEDDWRQFEFVSSAFAYEIKRELQAIDRVWQERSVPVDQGHGFRWL